MRWCLVPLQRFAQRNANRLPCPPLGHAVRRCPSPLAVWACAWCAASARLRAQREPRATRPRSATTACAPRSAAVAAAPIAQRSARSSQPPRRYAVLAPASPTPTLCRRSSGVVGLRLLVGAEAVARNPECARWRAGALACMALLVLQDRGGLGPRQSCDAERGPWNAPDASSHLVALVGLLCHRAVHDYALYAMLAVGSEAPRATRARMCAALVGRVCEGEPSQRGRRKGTWRARARQDASFKVPPPAGPRVRPPSNEALVFSLEAGSVSASVSSATRLTNDLRCGVFCCVALFFLLGIAYATICVGQRNARKVVFRLVDLQNTLQRNCVALLRCANLWSGRALSVSVSRPARAPSARRAARGQLNTA